MAKKRITCREAYRLLALTQSVRGYFSGLQFKPEEKVKVFDNTSRAAKFIQRRKPRRAVILLNETSEILQEKITPLLTAILGAFIKSSEQIMHPALPDSDLDAFQQSVEMLKAQLSYREKGGEMALDLCMQALDEMVRISLLSTSITQTEVLTAKSKRLQARHLSLRRPLWA